MPLQGSQQEAGWPPEGSTEQVEPQLEDPEAVAQAQVHAVSGACLAMGIRYAGTANPEARKTLLDHVSMYLKWKMRAPDPFAGKPSTLTPGSADHPICPAESRSEKELGRADNQRQHKSDCTDSMIGILGRFWMSFDRSWATHPAECHSG